jgi:hypothetical protein
LEPCNRSVSTGLQGAGHGRVLLPQRAAHPPRCREFTSCTFTTTALEDECIEHSRGNDSRVTRVGRLLRTTSMDDDHSGSHSPSLPKHRTDCDACLMACSNAPALLPSSLSSSAVSFSSEPRHLTFSVAAGFAEQNISRKNHAHLRSPLELSASALVSVCLPRNRAKPL